MTAPPAQPVVTVPSGGTTPPAPTGWAAIRAQARPLVALADEFGPAQVQAPAGDGWEDGISISRDGLHLYAVYVPADLLSFTLAGGDQRRSQNYLRGPTLGMDLTIIPAGLPDPQPTRWIHGDLVHASRNALDQPFGPWRRLALSQAVWSEGAPQPAGLASGGSWSLFAYTSNQHAPDYLAHICLVRGAVPDQASPGTMLPAPVTTVTNEDNPHVERLDASRLVLFFDSIDRQAGRMHDLWFTTSGDDGASWSAPQPVSTINTAGDEQQPHLGQDAGGGWWLYWSATNPADGKLGIYRARQQTAGSWDAWGAAQLVVGAGNTAGVGEPTLTAAGDLSFVVVMQDPAGSAVNRYDADPWFAPRRPTGVAAQRRLQALDTTPMAPVSRPWSRSLASIHTPR